MERLKGCSGYLKPLLLGLFLLTAVLHLTRFAIAQTSLPPPNPLLEEWILKQVAFGEEADLKRQFPDEKDRVLSAKFLERLLTNSLKDMKVHWHGVQIRNAIVNEPLDLIGAEIPFETSLMDCHFLKEVDLSRALFAKGISFEGSTFALSSKFYAMKLSGTASFDRTIFMRGADFREVETSRNVKANGAEFRSPGQPASFSSMKVGGYASFSSSKFSGPVTFEGAGINGNLMARQAEFRNGEEFASFFGMKVGGDVISDGAIFSGPVNFDSTVIAGHFSGGGASFRNKGQMVIFNNMRVGGHVYFFGVKFSGPVFFISAAITGDFNGNNIEFLNHEHRITFNLMKVGGNIYIPKAKFSGLVTFFGTDIRGDFAANGAEFRDANFNNTKIGGNAFLPGVKFSGPVTFMSADVRGDFEANGAEFRDANFNNMKVGGHVNFHKANFLGEVIFIGAEIKGNFQIHEAKYLGSVPFMGADIRGDFAANGAEFRDANFNNTKIGGNAFLPGVKFSGPVTFMSADVRGDFEANGAEFRDANFNNMKVGGHVNFHKANFLGEVIFIGAEIKGNLDAIKAEFTNPNKEVGFNNMRVGGDVTFNETKCSGALTFMNADITGNLKAFQSKFEKTVDFSSIRVSNRAHIMRSTFSGPVLMNDARFLHVTIQGPEEPNPKEFPSYSLDLSRTEIKGELSIKHVTLQRMIASALQVAGPTSIENLIIQDELNLKQSSFSNISMLRVTWPRSKNRIRLDGMSYLFISAGAQEDSWKRLLELVKGSAYDANVYTNLETFFRRQGYADRADRVFVEHKRSEREGLKNIKWFWSLLLEYLVWYGRKPERALAWSLVIIFLGSFMFKPNGMEPKNPGVTLPHYNALWYSLDLFVPVVGLQMASIWMPRKDRRFARNYAYIHKILGVILIPIGLAAITGIIK